MLQASDGSFIPSALGDRTPLIAGASYYANSSLALSGTWASYAAIYKHQLWVNTLVSKLAMAHARLPFGIRLPDGHGGWTSDPDGDLAALMRQPNPRMSGFRWWQWMSSTYDIYGESFSVKLRDLRGQVREIWPMHPENVRIEKDKDGDLWYVNDGQRTNGVAGRWHEDDVISFVGYNPDTITRGLSKLEPLRMTLLNEDASRRATAAFWRNGARPGVILSHPKTLSPSALSNLQQQFDADTAGSDNFGRTKILEEDMTATIVQLNLEEMQYVASRQLNREEACAAYDVPPPVVHILDRATFSNITEQLRSLYRDTMAPRNEMFEAIIDQQLVPDFYGSDSGAESRFDMDEVLRGDFETRATAIAPLLEKGVYRPNEARPLFGLPPAGPEADVLYGNAALVPLGSNARPQQVATDGTLMPQPLETPTPKAIAAPALTVRTIMGRLSQAKAAGTSAVRSKLMEEHAKELRAFFAKQKAAVVGQRSKAYDFTPTDWDDELAGILETLSVATTAAIGSATATSLGGKFDGAPIADWLAEDAKASAENLNATTAAQLLAIADRLEEDEDLDPDTEYSEYFDGTLDSRADEISGTRVAMLAGFAALVAAGQSGASRKRWVVTSANPRPSHAAVAGETVGINDTFSNGLNAPGDYTGGADEVAGCTCELVFEFEE